MKINNCEVYGLNESIVSSGYPMLSEPMGDIEFENRVSAVNEEIANIIEYAGFKSKNRDIERAIKLANAPGGSGHDCMLKGIIVQMDVNAPQYFWQQLQRYHFIDFVSSMSKMHRITTLADNVDAFDKKTFCIALEPLNTAIELYNDNEADIDDVLCNVPMGLEYSARMTANYLQLKTIYKQRRHHRSQQWQVFCDWIESLPMAKELIIGEKNNGQTN